ncbi:uncharacterized protein SPAPADRAFT_145126 [Spathaspora passalidarum NRRL Y-27907]|uniref:ORC6 first cyclin-like domain-containing protein n=1 Tax=Spathaspora passalidarum (strain NRRL Y-27907 / 11-Y1) TaxID=619300 RepID=G3AEG8_SPAPN|nr:uncharacterized protein SPAPADRAFT_145126 [Spathaspora passalidarum NRRL Y-27907]EGW34730.1 hypothetical protein SPAPADRAFT_145126 [Spathaspora passalidarum NRRL Y-27907]
MSTIQLKRSLRDVLPTYQGEFPPKLLDYIASLYQLSLRKQGVLPNKAEIARYHLCAYSVAEKYQEKFDLPSPQITRIPIQPKLVGKLLDDFREFIDQVSAASSPNTSPRKRRADVEDPVTPTKGSKVVPGQFTKSAPKVGSPLKRLQQLQKEDTPGSKKQKTGVLKDIESPFNQKTTSPSKSPFNKKNNREGSPSSPHVYKYDKKNVSISDFITFCNNFYIPAQTSAKMTETFLMHKHKFVKKSEWLLAAAMVRTAYIRINHKLLSSKVGEEQKFLDLLFQYQKGGLMRWNLALWYDIVDDWMKDEQWLIDIEKQFMYGTETSQEMKVVTERRARIGEGWDLMERLGAMLHGDVLYESKPQQNYYDTWSSSILK